MRILIVEDEALLAAQLDKFLRDEGFVVDMAGDGEVALYRFREYSYDAAIVDLGLPKVDGIDLIRRVRAEGIETPILITTNRDSIADKVQGYEAGADEYVEKTKVDFAEIPLKLNALIRRSGRQTTPALRAGDITLDTVGKTVSLAGVPIELTAYEYRVLEYLMMKPGQVVSKTELTEHLYEQDFDRDSNVIEVFVGRLRKKIDPAGDAKPIRTVRGQGYRFALEE